jgi:sugar phosphate isomerase/epimerase
MVRRPPNDTPSLFLAASSEEAPEAISAARARGLGLEVALFETREYLDSAAALAPLRRLASAPAPAVPLSAHGPIYDLNPGSPEPFVRDFTVRAMSASVRAAAAMGASRLVVHTGFNPLLPRCVERPWCASAAEALREIAEAARVAGTRLLVENFFEDEPDTLVRLADAIGGDVGFCFDLAHACLRSRIPFSEWMARLSPRLQEIHLNDCDGHDDAHLALGEGVCEIGPFLEALLAGPHRAIPIVLEMSLDRAAQSLAWLGARGFAAPAA